MKCKNGFSPIICKDQGTVYNFDMVKKTTLNELGAIMEHVVKHMATKEDVAEIKRSMDGMATKEQVVSLHMQVNSIETEIRGMKRPMIESRVADLEEKVFGEVRS